MANLQLTLEELSENFLTNLNLVNTKFEKSVLNFFKLEFGKCLILETRDTRRSVLRIRRTIKHLDIYGNNVNQIILKWPQFLSVVKESKVMPKFGNLIILEFSKNEPEFSDLSVLDAIIERINMVPAKKIVLLFNYQDCPESYLKNVNVDAYLKINEFTNTYTTLTDENLSEILFQSALNGRINHVNVLLEKGAKINEPGNADSDRTLHGAAEFGDKALISTLLRHGALIIGNRTGNTPLHIAAKNGYNDIVTLLLDHTSTTYSVDVNFKNSSGTTALHLAAEFAYSKVVKTLLNHGADINCKDNGDNAPLHFAATCQELEVVKILLERGALVTVKNKLGQTPLDLVPADFTEVEQLLSMVGRASRRSVHLGMI
ncbi:unnamed protein product [Ceutorhynchus assimilis]|uniref:Uncharacterized protein n=1 Tax=Ceutorhynchus assimilis TaxID=467358 RepID=A0A9N9MG89_9CUCU|nr:unnamed protein product [Ceutorhynchus assimilis]